MKSALAACAAVLCLAWLAAAGPAQQRPSEQWPAVKGYGHVFALPEAAVQPRAGMKYRMIFNVTRNEDKRDERGVKVNTGLWHLARALNSFALGGVSPEQLEVVAIIHGPATPVVLDDGPYRNIFGRDNPNLPLIEALEGKGVKLFVCGQALGDSGFQQEWVAPQVRVALSSLVVLPTFEEQGYALMPY